MSDVVKENDWVLFETEEGPIQGVVLEVGEDDHLDVAIFDESGRQVDSVVVREDEILAKRVGLFRKRWQAIR